MLFWWQNTDFQSEKKKKNFFLTFEMWHLLSIAYNVYIKN